MQDTQPPPQASFMVPNLGILIVPLVYGDHHSCISSIPDNDYRYKQIVSHFQQCQFEDKSNSK